MKPTLIETFDGKMKLLVNLGNGVRCLTFKDVVDLNEFLNDWRIVIGIHLVREDVNEAAIIYYNPPTNWAEEPTYNFGWWRHREDWGTK